MKINEPLCSFRNCKFCFDENCINKLKYERCEYILLLKNSGNEINRNSICYCSQEMKKDKVK